MSPAKNTKKTKTLRSSFLTEPLYPTVPVDEAVTATHTWCEYNTTLAGGNAKADFIRAFFIPKADLMAISQMIADNSQIDGCRVYLGMDNVESIEADSFPSASTLKMFMVAVQKIEGYTHGQDIVFEPNSGASMVYDFMNPCPSTCDIASVLYHDGASK